MLSNDALKLLKWLSQQDNPLSKSEIKENCKLYKERSFKALVSKKYLTDILSLESGQWAKYRVNDSGVAYIEGVNRARMMTIREWMSFGLSVAAIITSIIALLMQAEIL